MNTKKPELSSTYLSVSVRFKHLNCGFEIFIKTYTIKVYFFPSFCIIIISKPANDVGTVPLNQLVLEMAQNDPLLIPL